MHQITWFCTISQGCRVMKTVILTFYWKFIFLFKFLRELHMFNSKSQVQDYCEKLKISEEAKFGKSNVDIKWKFK
jgi:hypothetical protein